jgi:transcriptional regulator with XRE-family HTH domain/KaiC/GvpD/RAD55 family RecA-like ATPase
LENLPRRIASGVAPLDRLLEGLFIGDNVVWYDDAGSLAAAFSLNFLRASQQEEKPFIYVSFDRSPKNLLDKLGELARSPQLTIVDCFTHGKGAGSEVFLKFYADTAPEPPCRILCVEEPRETHHVMDAVYQLHGTLSGDVRFVFESLTGMQELWGGEDQIIQFYSHSCPRLYELNTVAYWIIEKRAHSQRLRAQINQIAQVAIDLAVRRGKTSLTLLKAEKRNPDNQNRPILYWSKDLKVTFESGHRMSVPVDLGGKLRQLRTARGFSQTELAKRIGVTPSTISQIESNMILPSLPALFKMAEMLAVDIGAFFRESATERKPVIVPSSDAVEMKLVDFPIEAVAGRRWPLPGTEPAAEVYLIEIGPGKSLGAHFFRHKGDEVGYVLAGELQCTVGSRVNTAREGDLIYLTSELPSQWKNSGNQTARLLWVNIQCPR